MPEAKEQNFSFIASSDIHSDVAFLRGICKTEAGKKAAFHVVMGDLLSHAAGPEALYNGIIDPMVIFLLPPGGFFVFGILVAVSNALAKKAGKKPVEHLGCANCP